MGADAALGGALIHGQGLSLGASFVGGWGLAMPWSGALLFEAGVSVEQQLATARAGTLHVSLPLGIAWWVTQIGPVVPLVRAAGGYSLFQAQDQTLGESWDLAAWHARLQLGVAVHMSPGWFLVAVADGRLLGASIGGGEETVAGMGARIGFRWHPGW